MEVCLGFLVERDVVVQPRDSGGDIDESPEEDTTRGDDLACKGELADEREQGSFGAGVPSDEVMERLEQLILPGLGDGARHSDRVEFNPQEGECGGGAICLLMLKGSINPGTEVCHESHVLLAGGGVWGPGGEKIIQVMDDMRDSIAVTEDPHESFG